MPFVIVILLVQLALVVHALKTGRNATWVFILLLFPVVGGLAYVIVELLPELTSSAPARRAKRKVAEAVNPDRNLRDAAQRLDVADTAANALRVAAELEAKSRFAEARDLYRKFLTGVHADDPELLLGLARAQFGLGEFADVVDTLDELRRRNPHFISPDGHLLYARALEGRRDSDRAVVEYEALVRYYAGPEPACRLALLYRERGRTADADTLFQRVVKESRTAGRHYNSLHREWIALAQRGCTEETPRLT